MASIFDFIDRVKRRNKVELPSFVSLIFLFNLGWLCFLFKHCKMTALSNSFLISNRSSLHFASGKYSDSSHYIILQLLFILFFVHNLMCFFFVRFSLLMRSHLSSETLCFVILDLSWCSVLDFIFQERKRTVDCVVIASV